MLTNLEMKNAESPVSIRELWRNARRFDIPPSQFLYFWRNVTDLHKLEALGYRYYSEWILLFCDTIWRDRANVKQIAEIHRNRLKIEKIRNDPLTIVIPLKTKCERDCIYVTTMNVCGCFDDASCVRDELGNYHCRYEKATGWHFNNENGKTFFNVEIKMNGCMED